MYRRYSVVSSHGDGGPQRLSRGWVFGGIISLALFGQSALAQDGRDHALKLLGKHVFFDTSLSSSGEMGCVTCHEPSAGGTHGDSLVNQGQVGVTSAGFSFVGRRKPQTNAYASFNDPFLPCNRGGPSAPPGVERYCGGNFWDGRALGRPFIEGEFAAGIQSTPHIGEEIFHDITSPRALRYARYISAISDQAMNPIPNVVEQNMPRDQVCLAVARSNYAWLYELAWGVEPNCSTAIATGEERHLDITFKRSMLAVGAYQHSRDINSFTSKRDFALRAELACIDNEFRDYKDPQVCKMVRDLQKTNPEKQYGKFPLVLFTDEENLGHDLFYNVNFAGITTPNPRNLAVTNCAFCHSDDPANDDGSELLQTYSDQAYHNIGVPPNPELIAASGDPGDLGLIETTGLHRPGFTRSQTLRNVFKKPSEDFVKAYMHNGFFKSLESVVHFYNTRDVKDVCEDILPAGTVITEAVALANDCWPAPEFPAFKTPGILAGDLNMSPEEEAALVAFMKTLDDMHTAQPPRLLRRGATDPVVTGLSSGQISVCEGEGSGKCKNLTDVIRELGEDSWLSSE
ncbi:cytochrome-c peroxidase [Microbulbifer guangxiensis]|uniref:cytochrome-c peroxidase n=1 Tax=Microbulbifer guangxiensis TaxID=2904249 RepID=UPI0021051060|nr:cytochrome c peroxidase [Microbulbifer guangxiensis]